LIRHRTSPAIVDATGPTSWGELGVGSVSVNWTAVEVSMELDPVRRQSSRLSFARRLRTVESATTAASEIWEILV
jgi:hypothetical protein